MCPAICSKGRGGDSFTKRKHFLIAAFSAMISLTLALVPVSTLQSGEYDPVVDINRDGKIDVHDLGILAEAYGSTGDLTQYLSIHYSAFTYSWGGPIGTEGPVRYRDNDILEPTATTYVSVFCAPVYLPNGANVTKITFFFKSIGEEYRYSEEGMFRYNLTSGTIDWIGSIQVVGPTSETSMSTTDIAYRIIDNSQFAYSLFASFSINAAGDLGLRGCIIEYIP